ncbi:unannotated protein [freshwater metagenome]|uniref:Unannotated protein n=1 Tax=freshwater metagenome TaxID=449393 RepID=A0A6J7J7I7_9ZZZZ
MVGRAVERRDPSAELGEQRHAVSDAAGEHPGVAGAQRKRRLDHGLHGLPAAGWVGDDGRRQRRLHGPGRREGVHGDVVDIELLGRAGDDAIEERFGAAVCAATAHGGRCSGDRGRARCGLNRGDREDPPGATLTHSRDHGLGERPERPDVHVDGALEEVARQIGERDRGISSAELARRCGGVHEHIGDSSCAAGHIGHELTLVRGRIGDVGAHDDGRLVRDAANHLDGLVERAGQIGAAVVPASDQCDCCALGRKSHGDRLPDAPAGTGDQRHAPFGLSRHRWLPRLGRASM